MSKINLGRLGLQGVEQLSRDEMKSVLGGLLPEVPANCSAKCADGSTIEITDCRGTCSCTDNVECTCSGSEPVVKSCGKPVSEFA